MTRDDRKNVTDAMARAISDKSLARIADALYNDLEMVVELAHPVVREIKQTLTSWRSPSQPGWIQVRLVRLGSAHGTSSKDPD